VPHVCSHSATRELAQCHTCSHTSPHLSSVHKCVLTVHKCELHTVHTCVHTVHKCVLTVPRVHSRLATPVFTQSTSMFSQCHTCELHTVPYVYSHSAKHVPTLSSFCPPWPISAFLRLPLHGCIHVQCLGVGVMWMRVMVMVKVQVLVQVWVWVQL
jgi:hypothetical protein